MPRHHRNVVEQRRMQNLAFWAFLAVALVVGAIMYLTLQNRGVPASQQSMVELVVPAPSPTADQAGTAVTTTLSR